MRRWFIVSLSLILALMATGPAVTRAQSGAQGAAAAGAPASQKAEAAAVDRRTHRRLSEARRLLSAVLG